MGKVVKKVLFVWRTWKYFFSQHAEFVGDHIVLLPGSYKIFFPSRFPPSRVWLNICEPEHHIPVCQANLNWVAAKIVDGGFILSATVNSQSCDVEWFLEF